ncbi:hypothetical protein Drorol1_Dr00013118, partial [Drosera rotundifolia]
MLPRHLKNQKPNPNPLCALCSCLSPLAPFSASLLSPILTERFLLRSLRTLSPSATEVVFRLNLAKSRPKSKLSP